MTIDEIIKLEEQIAGTYVRLEKEKHALFLEDPRKMRAHEERHRKIAEWLKELQRLRKKGEWIPKEDKGQKETVYQCSVCGAEFVSDGIDFHYCPRCGSNMRGED